MPGNPAEILVARFQGRLNPNAKKFADTRFQAEPPRPAPPPAELGAKHWMNCWLDLDGPKPPGEAGLT
jgi:hypothetical protein